MSKHLEAMLRHAWNAGFEASAEGIRTASWDVPTDHLFEEYMEKFIDELVGPEPKENSDD